MVLDPYDPTGMFSKAGRASIEMYQMILQRDRILYNKKPAYVPTKVLPFLDNVPMFSTPQQNNQIQTPNNQTQTQKSETFNQKPIIYIQPFSKMLSRELLKQLEKNDRRFGMYHPKYNLIYKRSPLDEDEKEQKDQKNKAEKQKSPLRRKMKTMSCHIVQSPPNETSFHYDEKPSKIIGPLPLNQQLGRDRKLLYSKDVNEKRFEFIDLPEICSNSHKVQTVHIRTSLGRSNTNFKRDDCAKGLEYKPKFHLVWPKSAVKIPDFSKNLARKGIENSNFVQNSGFSYEDSSFISNSGRKVLKTPNFSKMLAREKNLDETFGSSSLKKNS